MLWPGWERGPRNGPDEMLWAHTLLNTQNSLLGKGLQTTCVCGYLGGWLGLPGSTAGVRSWEKVAENRSFALVEIVIFHNLVLSSRRWKNQLVKNLLWDGKFQKEKKNPTK